MTQTEAARTPVSSPAATRTRGYHQEVPPVEARAAQTLSGLDLERAGISAGHGAGGGSCPGPQRLGQTLGFTVATPDDVQKGRVTFRMRPAEYHYDPIGSGHGGVCATLLDSAPGRALHSMLVVSMGGVRAVGEVLSVSRQVATAQAQVLDEAGKLYAHATRLILRPTQAGQPERAAGEGQ
ncbi:PaaI family thioesterase [Deinococcus sp.]|uniref:PaaI family thioesterase n=1 Tax=Deinococcus sp. TaxID=47478 RepID=UPI003C7A720C